MSERIVFGKPKRVIDSLADFSVPRRCFMFNIGHIVKCNFISEHFDDTVCDLVVTFCAEIGDSAILLYLLSNKFTKV